MDEIKVLSFAKINLSIDVKAVKDGYHQVDMIMQQLSFHDSVSIRYIENNDNTKGSISISLKTNRYYLPTDERNLAYKAARLMAERFGGHIDSGMIQINIKKRIPVSAGLAGGSGNGAAVIHGLNILWNLKLDLKEICDICAELGSDVPFSAIGQARGNYLFPRKLKKDSLSSSCARATGRGTELKPLRGIRKAVVIAKPAIGVSTAEVYKGIDDYVIKERPDNDRLEHNMETGGENIYEDFVNVLEEYTLTHYPEVLELKDIMSGTDAEKVLMSGSGPTVFAVYGDINKAMTSCDMLREKGYEAYWTKTTK